VLQCVAACNHDVYTLQHTATHCNTLQHTDVHDVCTLQRTATHCNALQHTAMHYNALQGHAVWTAPLDITHIYTCIHIFMCVYIYMYSIAKCAICADDRVVFTMSNIWSSNIWLQVIFRKRATNYRALCRKMSNILSLFSSATMSRSPCQICLHIYIYIYIYIVVNI